MLQIVSLFARRADLFVTSWVLQIAAITVALLILLVFQAELRRALMRIERALRPVRRAAYTEHEALAEGVFELAAAGLGALIVLPRRDAILELVVGGTPLGATVTPQVLLAVFQKSSPLHDGAAILEGDRITSVNVVLPLTRRADLPVQFGTRHRAAIGLSEICDAIVIVVSEETREVRMLAHGNMHLVDNARELVRLLVALLHAKPVPVSAWLRRSLTANLPMKFAALGLSCLVWAGTFVFAGHVVRTMNVPIEFGNVPRGLRVVDQSAEYVDVEIRGISWIVDGLSRRSVVARLDLSGFTPGERQIDVTGASLNLGPGLSADHIAPKSVTVKLQAIGN
jgi:DNA integrity scanning protein DisA with diadenylate cyclase activity